jgi:hypothetical protein
MLQLSRADLGTLWRQAFSDILPPLASLPFWLSASLFGFKEAGIRDVSLVFVLVARGYGQSRSTCNLSDVGTFKMGCFPDCRWSISIDTVYLSN